MFNSYLYSTRTQKRTKSKNYLTAKKVSQSYLLHDISRQAFYNALPTERLADKNGYTADTV